MFSIKGRVTIELTDEKTGGKTVIEKDNLWTDLGYSLLALTGATDPDHRLTLTSDSTAAAVTTDTLPNVVKTSPVSPSWTGNYDNVSFSFTWGAAVAEFTFRTVGLCVGAAGVRPYCYTVLAGDVTKADGVILQVTYSITFSKYWTRIANELPEG